MACYQGKRSGPLLDRIDLHIEVPRVSAQQLLEASAGEPTETIRGRAVVARERALARQGGPDQGLTGSELDRHAPLEPAALKFLRTAAARLGWSARSTHRALKVARTIGEAVPFTFSNMVFPCRGSSGVRRGAWACRKPPLS